MWLEAKMFGLWVGLCSREDQEQQRVMSGGGVSLGTEGRAGAVGRNEGHGSAGVVLGGMDPALVRVRGEELDLGCPEEWISEEVVQLSLKFEKETRKKSQCRVSNPCGVWNMFGEAQDSRERSQ